MNEAGVEPAGPSKMNQDKSKTRIAILGASGYTGVELLRMLAHHPNVEIVALTADRQAGKDIGAVFPHLLIRHLPKLTQISEVDWGKVYLVFSSLPPRPPHEFIPGLPKHRRILHLSADFRLADPPAYAK